MTAQEVIDHVDSVKPNAFTSTDKLVWLNEIEGRVQTEVFLRKPDELIPLKSVTDELMVPYPYSSLYSFYLQAMVDFHNNEYDRYDNTYAAFNKKWVEFMKWRSAHYPTFGKIEFGEMRVEE